MATPIDNKTLLQQFLEGSTVEEDKPTKSTGKFPEIESKESESKVDASKQKKNLRFSVTVPTPLALAIREYVTQTTIQRLIKGDNYNLSQFFSEAALHYMQTKTQESEKA